jgi:hypothetical protein
MEKEITLPVGIVVEKKAIDHPWAEARWRPVSLLPGYSGEARWQEVARGEGWCQFLCAVLPLTLHRKETEAYRVNLQDEAPLAYVVLRESENPDSLHEIEAVQVTASPFDAQDFLDSGDDIVESLAMPESMADLLRAFVAAHHVEEPFKKRKQKAKTEERPQFGKRLHESERRFYERMKPK